MGSLSHGNLEPLVLSSVVPGGVNAHISWLALLHTHLVRASSELRDYFELEEAVSSHAISLFSAKQEWSPAR